MATVGRSSFMCYSETGLQNKHTLCFSAEAVRGGCCGRSARNSSSSMQTARAPWSPVVQIPLPSHYGTEQRKETWEPAADTACYSLEFATAHGTVGSSKQLGGMDCTEGSSELPAVRCNRGELGNGRIMAWAGE